MNYREPISVTPPQVAKEWDYEKNGELTPLCATKGQIIKVWWKCNKCSHEWEAEVKSVVSGTRCPKCAGRK